MACRLLALDVDGTLLDPEGRLQDAVVAAVREAAARVRVVLCTGRRYRTVRPVLEALALSGPVVVHNGVLVVDGATGETLHPHYLPSELHLEIRELLGQVGPPLVYVDHDDPDVDILTEMHAAHPFQRAYLEDMREETRFVSGPEAHADTRVILMSLMADGPTLRAQRERVQAQLGSRAQTNFLINKNYDGYILEVVAPGTGKWPALAQVAAAAGVDAHDIVAVGDDENDLGMIEAAGVGVAMGNAIEAVKRAADAQVASNADAGVIEAIERFALR
ncbi:MAG: Cof-type HAD-IIB family hydrolase [Proteobacteria bacterium]|nr:Cof-type HAD-IIB family hydrolase [Pseudomonadota bacterium]